MRRADSVPREKFLHYHRKPFSGKAVARRAGALAPHRRAASLFPNYCSSRKLSAEPGLSHVPLAGHGGSRNAESDGRVIKAQAAKISKLDDAYLLLVDLSQKMEGFVQSQQIDISFVRDNKT